MKFSGMVGNGKWLNSGGNPHHNTGKTCLGGGMHCPSSSTYFLHSNLWGWRIPPCGTFTSMWEYGV